MHSYGVQWGAAAHDDALACLGWGMRLHKPWWCCGPIMHNCVTWFGHFAGAALGAELLQWPEGCSRCGGGGADTVLVVCAESQRAKVHENLKQGGLPAEHRPNA